MTTKSNKAKQALNPTGSTDLPPEPPHNFERDTATTELAFPPVDEQDFTQCDMVDDFRESLPDTDPEIKISDKPNIPFYKSPFIRGTSIPADDKEAVLMALINGDISLTELKLHAENPNDPWRMRTIKRAFNSADEQFEKDMVDAIKADADALAKLAEEKEETAKREAALAGIRAENDDIKQRPSKVVFHYVPVVRGKDEADVVEYHKLVGVKLRLGSVPERSVFETLYNEFPWMQDSIKYLENSCDMSRRGNGVLKFSPLLLLGASGVGKTSLARRFCELSNIPYVVLSAGGSNDSMLIKGVHRGWSSAQAGSVVYCIKQHKVANPVIIIDEIDKTGISNTNGNLVDSLIQMLEPSSASVWMDEFLQGRVDLSSVNFIMTANDITKLGSPLLSRTRQVKVGFLNKKDLQYAIPKLIKDTAESYGINKALIPEIDANIAGAIAAKCSDLRKLKLAVQAWFLVAMQQSDKHTGQILH